MNRVTGTRRVWCIIALIVVAPFILSAAAWTFASIRYSHLLANELASLHAQGYPLSMAEVKPQPVPDSLNAAVLYMKVFQIDFRQPKPGLSSAGLNRPDFRSLLGSVTGPITPSLRTFMAKSEVQQDLAMLRAASLRPYNVFPLTWERWPNMPIFAHMSQFRQAARLVSAQALLEAEAGHLPQALDWLAVDCRMATHIEQEPTLIPQLVGSACRGITTSAAKQVICPADLSAAEAAPLLRRLDSQQFTENFDRAMQGEVAGGLALRSQIRQEKTPDLSEFSQYDIPVLFMILTAKSRLWRPYWDLETYNYARDTSRKFEAYRQPFRLRSGKPEEKPAHLRIGHIMAGILSPMYGRAAAMRDQSLAEIALVQTTLALKVYRHEHGSYPDTLAALPTKAPEDPFSGQPLVYRRQHQGFKLYSVGPNLRDDGGHEPGRPGDIMTQGDIVWECVK